MKLSSAIEVVKTTARYHRLKHPEFILELIALLAWAKCDNNEDFIADVKRRLELPIKSNRTVAL